jgi:hypothetical protein
MPVAPLVTPTTDSAEIGDSAMAVPPHGMDLSAGRARLAHDRALTVDGMGSAVPAAKVAEVDDRDSRKGAHRLSSRDTRGQSSSYHDDRRCGQDRSKLFISSGYHVVSSLFIVNS